MTTSKTRALFACALLASTSLAAPAFAQTATTSSYPVRQFADANGVDLLSGTFTTASYEVLIGDRDNGLSFQREVRGGLYRDNLLGTIESSDGTNYTVALGGSSDKFVKQSDGSFTAVEQRGTSLTYDSGAGTYSYRGADGTVGTFIGGNYDFGNAAGIALSSVTFPSAKKLDFHFTTGQFQAASTPSGPTYVQGRRLQSVTSNTGYHMKLTYESDAISSSGDVGVWSHVVKATGLNSLVDSCSTEANECTASGPRPSLSISTLNSNDRDYTDSLGRTTTYRFVDGKLTAIRRAGSTTDNVAVGYTGDMVSSVNADGITTTYAYSDAEGVRTVTVTRGSAPSRVAKFDLAKSQLIHSQDELGRVTQYEYDASARLTKVIFPEGNSTSYTYDSRGNVTSTTHAAKPGSSEPNMVSSASFDATCTVAVKCNKPNNTTDARGNVTDFSYDITHGGLISATLPAAPNGVRPQTRYSYAQIDANGSASSSGMFRLTAVSACQTQSSCAGGSDEVKSTLAYGQNQLPTSASAGSGDGSLTATSAMTYDAVGNLLTVDGPLSGSEDSVRNRYDAGRQLVGTVGPDPDGSGGLKHRALRTTYNPLGQVSKRERGTVNSQSDADWGAMSVLETVETDYDASARPVTQKLVAGGAVQALTQTSYDALGRPECVARRMNPGAFASLPSSACSLGTEGSFGPDRITRTVYDAAGQVTEVRTAVGMASEAAEVASTYTANGKVATATDGENNKTTYEYDGHDRLARTLFPSPTKGAGTSNANDYEQRSYDAASSVTAYRNRAGETIAFSYDNLGRLTLKDLPGTEPDVSFSHDLLGRMTSASQSGHSLSFAYDALGRKLSETWPHGTVASSYDVAGRRTRLTHADGFAVDHNYLVTGEMTQIVQPGDPNNPFAGNTVLVSFGYDDLGRRTSLTRLNGTSTSYGYDPVSRLSQLVQDAGGTDRDLTLGFSYNPASQIASNSRSNDAYAFTAHTSGTITETPNGLNQLVNRAGTNISHDAKGNVTFDPTTGSSFAYSSENLLTRVSIGTWSGALGYDPLLRLYQSGSTKTGYDGHDRLARTLFPWPTQGAGPAIRTTSCSSATIPRSTSPAAGSATAR